MATGAPTSQTGSVTDHGFAYMYAPADIDLAIMDALDATKLPTVRLRGSFAGQGTTVMRVEYIDSIGFANPMAALASETDAIAISTPTSGYSTITMGEYGVAYGQTYTSQITGRQPGIGLENIGSLPSFVGSYLARFRALYCAAGAGITNTVGSVLLPASIDDYLDLLAIDRGYSSEMAPASTITMKNESFSQLLESARAEPGFQGNADSFATGQAGGNTGQFVSNFLGLGKNFVLTDDVTASGGGHNNFLVSDGGIGYAVGDTSRIMAPSAVNPIAVPEWGILIQDVLDGLRQSTLERQARAWLGVAIGSTEVYRQRRWISIDA